MEAKTGHSLLLLKLFLCSITIPHVYARQGQKTPGMLGNPTYWRLEKLQCGQPGGIVGGKTEPNNVSEFQEGDAVLYTCEPRYQFLGSPVRKCIGGQWNGSLPVCAVPVQLVNANQKNDFSTSTVAQNAIDGNYSTCSSLAWGTKNGYWYASFNGSLTSIAAIRITFSKDADVLVGARIAVEFEKTPTSCRKTGNYTDGPHMKVLFQCPKNTHGKYITITDHLKGDHYFQLYEVEVFTSTNITCHVPDTPLNGHKSFIFHNFRPIYRYQCKEGYQLIGDQETYCLGNGTWTPAAPICKAITCPSAMNITNGWLTYNSSRKLYNETATYTCYPGFIMSGSPVQRCTAEGKWSGKTPQCLSFLTTSTQRTTTTPKEIRCSAPPNIEGGMWIPSNRTTYKVELNLTLQCTGLARPIKMPLATIYCQKDGKWSEFNSSCSAIRMDMVQGSPESPTSKMAMIISFLIGAATSIIIIGVIACVFACRKRQVTTHQSSQSIFHVVHPHFSIEHSMPRFSESAATETTTSEYNDGDGDDDDEHIYQVAIYEQTAETSSKAESTLPMKVSNHVSLHPCYSQPYESKRTLADFHIYCEPVGLMNDNNYQSAVADGDLCNYSDNAYSYISEGRCESQQDSYYPSSTTTTTTTDTLPMSRNLTVKMKENDLYESDSEDDVFQ